MKTSRRGFLSLSVPAIVCAANIMPVHSIAHLLTPPAPRFDGAVGGYAYRATEDGGIDLVPRELLPPNVWRALTGDSTDYSNYHDDDITNFSFQWREDRGQLTLHAPRRMVNGIAQFIRWNDDEYRQWRAKWNSRQDRMKLPDLPGRRVNGTCRPGITFPSRFEPV